MKDGKERREGLRLISKLLASASGSLASSNSIFMVRGELIGTGFGGIALMKFLNDFISMCEVGGGGPLILFVGTLIAHPSNIVV